MQALDPISLFNRISTLDPVMAAVSGGSDSIALLLLASTWAKHHNIPLKVVTVDHGLRPEAAAEAAFVAGVSESLGHSHVTLAWDGIKPSAGISEASRNARYRLMSQYAVDVGIKVILSGHTLNDQAETIVMRSSRSGHGSQLRGLSGMANRVYLSDELTLERPLLGTTREQLRTYLRSNQQSWIEDPSNEDVSYERVRVRKRLGDNKNLISHISRFGALNARARKVGSTMVAHWLMDVLEVSEGPVLKLGLSELNSVPKPVKLLSVQVLIAMVGGAEYFVAVHRIEAFLENDAKHRITLGNAVIEKSDGILRLFREIRNLPSILVPPGEEALWDGRLYINNQTSMTYFCGPLDMARKADAENILGRRIDISPKAVLDSTPYLCGDGDNLYLPFVWGFERPKGVEISPVVRAIEYFCPEFDAALLSLVRNVNLRIMGAKQNNS